MYLALECITVGGVTLDRAQLFAALAVWIVTFGLLIWSLLKNLGFMEELETRDNNLSRADRYTNKVYNQDGFIGGLFLLIVGIIVFVIGTVAYVLLNLL